MKKLAVVTMTGLLVTGCASNEVQQGGIFGAIVGGVAGYAACDGKASCIAAGALAGAVIGGAIAQYLTEQDQANISNTLNDTEHSQPVAWCSNSRQVSNNVNNVNCGDGNKIITKADPVVANAQGGICRDVKTDIEMPNGNIKTDTQTVCKGQDGKWHEQTA